MASIRSRIAGAVLAVALICVACALVTEGDRPASEGVREQVPDAVDPPPDGGRLDGVMRNVREVDESEIMHPSRYAGGDEVETRFARVGEELSEAASSLVRAYDETGVCLVRQAGYLDLAGDVWGCVLEGPGWVDVCVLSREGERESVVRVERLGTEVADVGR